MGLFSRQGQEPTSALTAILIVEDEPLVAFENERALAHAGYPVIATVDRYADAVEVLERGGVGLIVADVRLAGDRTGLDVARHAALLAVPVLFSTAACPAEAHPLGLGWIAKPYGPRDLVRAIQAVAQVLDGRAPAALPAMMTLFDR